MPNCRIVFSHALRETDNLKIKQFLRALSAMIGLDRNTFVKMLSLTVLGLLAFVEL